MSICRGVAGLRGGKSERNFYSQRCRITKCKCSVLQKMAGKSHPLLENGFAHAYVASDGILYAEDARLTQHGTAGRQYGKPEAVLRSEDLSEYGGFGNL